MEKNVVLYRDDGLALLKNTTGRLADKTRKELIKIFDHLGLKITAQTNPKSVNFLDITFNPMNGDYRPYRKPNDEPLYISSHSNHRPSILKHLPASINSRISQLSSNQSTFDSAAPIYEDALRRSHFNTKLQYIFDSDKTPKSTSSQKRRRRNMIWFNPPYSKNIKSKIGYNFLKLINKDFPESCTLHKIFNRNTVKVSYSCMDNMKTMITKRNSRILNKNENRKLQGSDKCNCRRKEQCSLQGNCLTNNIVYRADVTTTDTRESKQYIGLTANSFKERYRNHIKSFEDRKYSNETELSKYIWDVKSKNRSFGIKWTIVKRASAYTSGAKRYNLCLEGKLCLI